MILMRGPGAQQPMHGVSDKPQQNPEARRVYIRLDKCRHLYDTHASVQQISTERELARKSRYRVCQIDHTKSRCTHTKTQRPTDLMPVLQTLRPYWHSAADDSTWAKLGSVCDCCAPTKDTHTHTHTCTDGQAIFLMDAIWRAEAETCI